MKHDKDKNQNDYEKSVLFNDGRSYEIVLDKKTNHIIKMRPIK